jgi:hypothetical protein
MIFRRDAALPHAHHIDLVQAIAEDVRRHLARLGMMRALTLVRVGASGAYRIDVVPACDVRLGFLIDLGIAATEAIPVIDDVLSYDPDAEAAVLIHETNPIDGALVTFLVQDIAVAR